MTQTLIDIPSIIHFGTFEQRGVEDTHNSLDEWTMNTRAHVPNHPPVYKSKSTNANVECA